MSERVLRLSEEQAAVVRAFGKDVGVSAAAGSGKTTVLVERYLEAVTKYGARPDGILAVTFTDKAANVMKERLRRRTAELGLEEVRRGLDGAWIGTIHSFCARFLKENPIECGVDPAFKVLGAGEADVLMDEVLDRLFEEGAESERFLSLLAELGEEPMREALKAFYDRVRAEAGSASLLRAEPMDAQRRAAEKALAELAQRLSALPPKASAAEERLSLASVALAENLKKRSEGWTRYHDVLGAVAGLDLRSTKTKESVGLLKARTKEWGALHLQALAVPAKEEWRRLVARFSEAYEAEKRRLGALDFEDLLCSAHRALAGGTPQREALLRRAKKQFSFIFVDEYQDTSLLQAGILERLRPPGGLFVVGDARQSIYRFRHAHPEIFDQVLKRSQRLSLSDNYRSRPEILELVNRVFSELLGGTHEPLRAQRRPALQKEHCLERIAVPKDERPLDTLRVLEARSIASRIRELVESGFQVEEKGKARPAAWRDFAVILRKTTASRIYEKELEAFGIPYFVNKGRGFYEKTEVADLMNFLRILENPSENLAMASVLRSPLVQLSDDGLYWVSRRRLSTKPEGTLYSALVEHASIPELGPEDRSRLSEFLSLFDELRDQKDRLKLSEILHRILDATAYEAKLATRPEGRQAAANVWKLVEMTGDVEERSVHGISDLILYLKSVSESSETESEARVIGEDEDVVRILTVHAAKGLEFPCVILADLGGEERAMAKPAFVASAAHGLGARLKDAEEGDLHEDASYTAISEEEKRMEAEESTRLLYVAMTRAMDHLILAGVWDEKKADGNWMQTLSRFLSTGTKVHEAPVVLRRTEKRASERMADRIPKTAEPGLAEAFQAQWMPADKHYQTLEDLTVSRLVSSASPHVPLELGPELSLPDEEEAQNESTPRNEFGTVYHLLMELAARNRPRGTLSPETVETVTAVLTPEEKKEIAAGFDAFWKGEFGLRVKKAAKCYPELPFLYKTGFGLLKGQMDLVFRDAEGWTILDYKTGRLSQAGAKEKAVQTYTWQLGLYALAFWKIYGEIPRRTVLYFSDNGESVELAWDEARLGVLAGELEEMYRATLAGAALDF